MNLLTNSLERVSCRQAVLKLYVLENDLELSILLPPPLESEAYSHVPLCLVYVVLAKPYTK